MSNCLFMRITQGTPLVPGSLAASREVMPGAMKRPARALSKADFATIEDPGASNMSHDLPMQENRFTWGKLGLPKTCLHVRPVVRMKRVPRGRGEGDVEKVAGTLAQPTFQHEVTQVASSQRQGPDLSQFYAGRHLRRKLTA